MLRIHWEGEEPYQTPDADFLEANVDDREVCESVSSLLVGEVAVFGGGAAPLCKVERIAGCEICERTGKDASRCEFHHGCSCWRGVPCAVAVSR